ncbi:response regulator [Desulfococcaceae bacterium HSG9]|nr:response regulator [Desulfococcaceae bacterium HSG9]
MTVQTILLVDDEEDIRDVLSISLEDRGYQVYTAENGQTALDMYDQMKPSIVITDIKMPGIDGIELLRELKRRNPDIEVIMITGHGDLELAIQSLKLEATDFVTKPINDDILDIALKRALDRMQMRRQLRAYTENLEKMVEEKTRQLIDAERMAAVGETVSGLSHAIKNIAGGLKGGAFVLEKGITLDNKTYLLQGWEMLKGNVDRIRNLSLNLLDYGKAAAMQYRLCDPNQPVREVSKLMVPQMKSKGILLQTELATDLKPICFDPENIHRSLLNLVTNAFDACIEKNACPEKQVVILQTSKPPGWGVEYRVSDNCGGMDAQVREKIFRTFFSTKGVRGSGIGLMLTNKIVKQHNGVIEVESQPGLGTQFSIRLPERQS